MTRIIISGANGFMGQVVAKIVADDKDVSVMCGIDKITDRFNNPFPVYSSFEEITESADVIIDFSRPDALGDILSYAQKTQTPAVLCTTGYSEDDMNTIKKAAETVALFKSANMSLGVNLQMDLISQLAEFLGHDYDIEIVEKHHNRKVDAPSGTALALADVLNDALHGELNYVYGRSPDDGKRGSKDIGIHAVRGGTVVGEHEVAFYGNDEIITVTHQANSRTVFASGAVRAAKFLAGKPAGLYAMDSIIKNPHIINNMYFDQNQAMVSISNIPADSLTLAGVFEALSTSGVNIDIVTQSVLASGDINLSFSLSKDDLNRATASMTDYIDELDHVDMRIFEDITKITVEGSGMEKEAGVAAKLFSALALENISVKAITTSETKIAFCVTPDQSMDALALVSKVFDI
ncbi:MAG: 4-hydroxy-tetrahydrodipicolinate reductase [Eubacteriales bacterium]